MRGIGAVGTACPDHLCGWLRFRGSGGQTLRQRARHVRRHLHPNDGAHGAMPVIEQVQRHFYIVIEHVGGCQFRRTEVVRRRSSEFGDHGCFTPSDVGSLRDSIWETRPPVRRPRACLSPTGTAPAAPAAADAGESRPAIRPPSPARRRFDGGKILRSAGDVVGPARGLRVGGECRRSCERQREREGERDFAHQFLFEVAAMCPASSARESASYPAGSFGPRRVGVEPGRKAPPVDLRRDHTKAARARASGSRRRVKETGQGNRSKREAPAVVGPGLSCRSVTTILADRDAIS